ncbi:hypothetical protein F5148DRAFT_1238189 [Russula earlei]|uniref:Uncharacterized protein n=1 Tax=Russula earlei TaxID=71964 RepID=A0ACC0TXQ5_9AGAM|nr:hypothetical protein F5148DRAFT_1238189 [Russula earlei]
MPTGQTIPLPAFLPFPGEQLRNLLPPNHDSLPSILGLAHAYLKHLHPSKLTHPDESMKASADLLKLFLNDTLVTALPLGHHPQSTAPTRELNSLQNRLTSLETTLINLTQASVDVRKEIKALPKNTTTPTKAKPRPPFPPHPSAVMKTSAYTWPASLRPNPADICATINSALRSTNNNQVHMSATRWTQKGNLVIWGGLNTMAHNLMTSLPAISEALQASLSVNSISAPQEPPPVRPNVKWSKLTINAAPTGKTNTREAYTPQECHQALLAENPTYATLTITQPPSWVRPPSTYAPGVHSSLSVSFEDPDGTKAQALLCLCTLHMLGHVVTLKHWRSNPPKNTNKKHPTLKCPTLNPIGTTPTPSAANFSPSPTPPAPTSFTRLAFVPFSRMPTAPTL